VAIVGFIEASPASGQIIRRTLKVSYFQTYGHVSELQMLMTLRRQKTRPFKFRGGVSVRRWRGAMERTWVNAPAAREKRNESTQREGVIATKHRGGGDPRIAKSEIAIRQVTPASYYVHRGTLDMSICLD
jgi:hypothetical protein